MPGLTKTLFVKVFDETIRQWTEFGVSPFLDSIDTANRLEATTNGLQHAYFTFEQSSITDPIKAVRIELYMKGGNEVSVELDDGMGNLKSYVLTPISVVDYTWRSDDVSNFLDSWTKINSAKMKITKNVPKTAAALNVDGFTNRINEWLTSGASPWLDAQEDNNYIYAKSSGAEIGDFTFEDLTKPWAGGTVNLNIYCKSDDGDDQIDVYLYDGSTWQLAGTITPYKNTYRVETIDVSAILNTEAKINAAKVYFVKQSVAAPNYVYIDRVYLSTSVYDEQLLAIAAARIAVDYYEGGVWTINSPSSTEAIEAGWSNPEGAYDEDNFGYAEASGTVGEQKYGGYNLPSAEEVYEVHVLIDGYEDESADVVGVSVSTDGGTTWSSELIAGLGMLAESTKDLDFTTLLDLTPSGFTNENFKVKIRKGQEGCLLPESLIALWIENQEKRKELKGECEYVSAKELLTLKPLPRLLGFEDGKFKPARILTVQLLEGEFDCYKLTCEDQNGYVKRASGTGDHAVWEWFSGLKKLRDVKIGDVLGGLYWNEEKQDYELKPITVKNIETFTRDKCIHLETDCKHVFTFTIKASFIKW